MKYSNEYIKSVHQYSSNHQSDW